MRWRNCPGCRELRKQVAALEARIRDLEARLGLNASNSSLPPSANPPQAPKPVVKEPTGRKPGGQPGHQACQRLRLPRERIQHVIRLIPDPTRYSSDTGSLRALPVFVVGPSRTERP